MATYTAETCPSGFVPFTYLLRFRPTGELYYGSKYGRGAHPSLLWTKYFTSSKEIKKLRLEHGDDAFDFEVRQIFKTGQEATDWERRLLRRVNAKHNPKFLNLSAVVGDWRNTPCSDEHKTLLSKLKKGVPRCESDLIAMRSAAQRRKGKYLGRPQSEAHVAARSAAMKGKNTVKSKAQLEQARKAGLGKRRTDEQKLRYSQSQIGMKYIHRGQEQTKVRPDKIQDYLDQGWILGGRPRK